MSLDTTVAFIIFCAGFLLARPERGVMRMLSNRTSGGAMARRLLPMALLVPWILARGLDRGGRTSRLLQNAFGYFIACGRLYADFHRPHLVERTFASFHTNRCRRSVETASS